MRTLWTYPLLLLVAASAGAGTVVRMAVTDHDRDPVRTTEQRLAVEDGILQIDTALDDDGDPTTTLVFRPERREILVLDHDARTFMVLDEAAAERLSETLRDAMAEVEAQLADVPAEQRAQVEAMMRQMFDPPVAEKAVEQPIVELRSTGEKAERQGYPCRRQELWRDGARRGELWVTDWDRVAGGRELFIALRELGELADQLVKAFGRLPQAEKLGRQITMNPFSGLEELEGFPVESRLFDGEEPETEVVLLSTAQEELGLSTFQPPADYRSQTLAR